MISVPLQQEQRGFSNPSNSSRVRTNLFLPPCLNFPPPSASSPQLPNAPTTPPQGCLGRGTDRMPPDTSRPQLWPCSPSDWQMPRDGSHEGQPEGSGDRAGDRAGLSSPCCRCDIPGGGSAALAHPSLPSLHLPEILQLRAGSIWQRSPRPPPPAAARREMPEMLPLLWPCGGHKGNPSSERGQVGYPPMPRWGGGVLRSCGGCGATLGHQGGGEAAG